MPLTWEYQVDTAVDIAKEAADAILLGKEPDGPGVSGGNRGAARFFAGTFSNTSGWVPARTSGNMFSVIGASLWLPYLPMSPIKILTNNLLYDFFTDSDSKSDEVDPEQVAQRLRPWSMGDDCEVLSSLHLGRAVSVFRLRHLLPDVVPLSIAAICGWRRPSELQHSFRSMPA